jgi:polyisoprenoid-binding protein YceI
MEVLKIMKYFLLLASLAAAAVAAIPGKPLAVGGPWQVDPRYSNAQLITDATTNYGQNKIDFALGNARVTGRVQLDSNTPANSSFNLTMYPATSSTPPIGEDGKVKSRWISNLANQTLICFHSKTTSRTTDGHLRAVGTLVLTRVDRNVEYNPSEAFSGPTYGPPMVHRTTTDVTFVFGDPKPPDTPVQATDAELVTFGSTKVVTEDFPQLFKVLMSTYWPPVVMDENCQQSGVTGGEDYSGPRCTGTFVDSPSLPAEPTGANIGREDYGSDSSGFNKVIGNQVNILMHLHLKPGPQQAHEKSGD